MSEEAFRGTFGAWVVFTVCVVSSIKRCLVCAVSCLEYERTSGFSASSVAVCRRSMFCGGEEISLVSGMPSCLTLPAQTRSRYWKEGETVLKVLTSMPLDRDGCATAQAVHCSDRNDYPIRRSFRERTPGTFFLQHRPDKGMTGRQQLRSPSSATRSRQHSRLEEVLVTQDLRRGREREVLLVRQLTRVEHDTRFL